MRVAPHFGHARPEPGARMVKRMKKILILGVNGFIGHHLSKHILATTDWQVFGMDMNSDRVTQFMDNPRF